MLLDLNAWKKNPSNTAPLRKIGTFEIESKDGADPATSATSIIRMSSATPDRDKDTIAVEGWELGNYRKNPVVLFAHNASAPPVGTSLREWVEGGFLKQEVEWMDRDLYEFGWMIGQMVKLGKLRAASVGFQPLEYAFSEERSGSWGPAVDFKRQELLENSIVPIPANPEALVESKGFGLPIHLLAGWAEETLAAVKGKGVWLGAETLEGALVKTLDALPARSKHFDLGAGAGGVAPSAAAVPPPASAPAPASPAAPKAAPVEIQIVKGVSNADLPALLRSAIADAMKQARTSLTGKLD